MIRNNIIISALVGDRDTSPLSIITSAIFTVLSFFYVYTVGSYFKVMIIYLQDRVTHNVPFSNVYVTSQYVDHIVLASGTVLWLVLSINNNKIRWFLSSIYTGLTIISAVSNISIVLDIIALLSIPIILSCWVYDRYNNNNNNRSFNKKVHNFLNPGVNSLAINYISIVGIVTAIASIVVTLVIHFLSVPSLSIPIRNYSYDIFLLLGNFSPFLIFLLIISFPVKILINEFITKKLRTMPKSNKSNTTYDTYNNNNNNNSSSLLERSFRSNGSYIVRRKKIIYLLLFMILSIIIVLVPHQPAINKNNQQIGIDSRVYVDWLNPLLKSNNFQEFIQQASPILLQIQQAGDRPLSVIFLFAVAKLVNNPDLSYVIEHVPVILGPALVLATYFLTRELTSNDTTSLLAAFLTAISFHVLIGVYAGYYANWFSLIIGYLSIAFLIRFVKKSGNNNKINFIMFFVSLVLLQFAHIYTWGVLTLVLGIFLGVMLKLNYYVKKKVVLALLSIVSLIVIDFAAITLWTSGRTGLMERELTIVSQAGVGIQDFAKRWANLVYTTQIYFIGLFGNFIMLSLGSYWLYRSDLREQSTIFLIIFLSMGLLPLFFGDVLIKARVLYNIAFQIPAAIALTYLRQYRYGGNILVLSTCLWLFAISIRTISNFVGPL